MKALYETLLEAGTDYTCTQQAIDDTLNQAGLVQAAAEVDVQIAGLGEITLDSGGALDVVRAAYNALTDEQKGYVTKLDTLETAENTYAELKEAAEQEAANRAAAAEVDEKIAAIGTVTPDSGEAIDAARAAYDALTDEQKSYVTKLDTLEAAEKAYADLKAEQEQQPEDPSEPSGGDEDVNIPSGGQGSGADDGNHGNQNAQDSASGSGQGAGSTASAQSGAVKTADSAQPGIWAGICAAALAGILLTAKKAAGRKAKK